MPMLVLNGVDLEPDYISAPDDVEIRQVLPVVAAGGSLISSCGKWSAASRCWTGSGCPSASRTAPRWSRSSSTRGRGKARKRFCAAVILSLESCYRVKSGPGRRRPGSRVENRMTKKKSIRGIGQIITSPGWESLFLGPKKRIIITYNILRQKR